MAWRIYRWWKRIQKDFINDLVDFLIYIWTSISDFFYNTTLPITHRLLSRRPDYPSITVKDIRANRIRLNIEPRLSSLFNKEQYEVQWCDPADENWQSVGTNELTQRTVARLKPDKTYKFRVRAYNNRGHSMWTPPLTAKTRLEPVQGGGYGPDFSYTWTQTAAEVAISFQLPSGVTKRDITLGLTAETLLVEIKGNAVPGGHQVLLDGELYNTVQGWNNGSYWELTREKSGPVLTVTLEKVTKSLAPKFDYWRSFVIGHDEIDTHKIVNENAGNEMGQPAMFTPEQIAAMKIPMNGALGR